MKMTITKLAWLFTAILLAQFGTVRAANIVYQFSVSPPGSVKVVTGVWQGMAITYGTATTSGTFTQGDSIQLNFEPASGYAISKITENGTNVTSSFSAFPNGQYQTTTAALQPEKFVITCVVQQPLVSGSFVMGAPLGAGATPVSAASGNYYGIVGIQAYAFDVATDETGKFTGMGTVQGLTAVSTPPTTKIASQVRPEAVTKTYSPDLSIAGSLATSKAGQPTASIAAALNGQFAATPAKGSFSAALPLVAGTSGTATVSGAGSAGKKSVAVKNQSVTVPSPSGGASTAWGLNLAILSGTTAKGKPTVSASVILVMPTGDRVSFPSKLVTYSPKKGFVVSFANGIKVDGSNNPILTTKGKKIVVKNTLLSFTELTFNKSGSAWTPAGGTVSYRFLGQKGTGDLSKFTLN